MYNQEEKAMKKTITIMLVLSLLVGIMMPCASAFSDISDTPEKEYISTLAEKGVVKGYASGTFAPNDLCTREQFITFLYRAAGEPKPEKAHAFSDVPSGAYFEDAVSWAYENGITNGAGDGKFGVGKTIDRNLASYYLYKWAQVTKNGNMTSSCYLADYEDGADVSLYARTSYAWAIGSGVFVVSGNKLSPAGAITRGETIGALGRLLSEHYHVWGEYTNNGDGTHTRICERDGSHIETEAHTYNNGELTSPVSEYTNGEITYTCTKCLNQKKDKVRKGTEIVTREDLEEAITSVAWAYYAKEKAVQYDSWHFSKLYGYLGGHCRSMGFVPPEVGTSDTTYYSVCSAYTSQAFFEATNLIALGEINHPLGFTTTWIFRYADNQRHTTEFEETLNDPITEKDVDAAIIRWLDYDRYSKSKRDGLYVENVLESDSFTDNFPGLVYKNDAPDGETHFGYYDENGNALTAEQVKLDYINPIIANCDDNFRPGDFAMYGTHAMIYIGNNTFLHCTGYKINPAKREDILEETGAIHVASDLYKNTSITERVKSTDNFVMTRPLDFFVAPGYDKDPGNDIVADAKVPEKTKSRMKYPNMDIDRTVDITPFGTVATGENLTYSIKISNRTTAEKYLDWYARANNGADGKVTYQPLTITEAIPEGCEFVEANNGASFSDGIVTWKVNSIKPGETVELTYTVKVTAEVGETIVSDGGMVDNIPSNSIENTVGAAKFSDSEKKTLLALNDLSALGGDTDFAENIYNALGKELKLPSVGEIIDNLFTYSTHIPGNSAEVGGLYSPVYKPINVFVRQTELSDKYADTKAMLIDRYWGGASFYAGEDLKWDYVNRAIKETRTDYLEAGDIIVYADVTEKDGELSYTNDHIIVMVYDGEKLLCSDKSEGGVTHSIIEGAEMDTQLLSALFSEYGKGGEYELFFALRPSQVK